MQNISKKAAERTGVALIALLLIAIVCDISVALLQRWQAGRLLALMQQTKVGVTSEAEFQRSAERLLHFTGLRAESDRLESVTRLSYTLYHRALLIHGKASADSGAMQYRTFPYWYLVQMSVEFGDGRVVEKHGLFVTPGLGRPEFSVSMDERLRANVLGGGSVPTDYPHHYVLHRSWDSASSWHRIYVNDDDEAVDADKAADWNVNLGCMLKFGGCRDAREILPGVRVVPPPDKYR